MKKLISNKDLLKMFIIATLCFILSYSDYWQISLVIGICYCIYKTLKIVKEKLDKEEEEDKL